MIISMDAEIACTDGHYGHLNSIILNPKTAQVTDLVVQRDGLFAHAWLVPVAHIVDSTPNRIRLDVGVKEIADEMLPFIRTEYLSPEVPDVLYTTDMVWPHLMANVEAKTVEHENVPHNELAVHGKAVVTAEDGMLGYLQDVIVDPQDWRITQIEIRTGHWYGHARLNVPISVIDHFGEDAITLSISKQEVEALTPTWEGKG
jgi:uncharacterized protein YrrD